MSLSESGGKETATSGCDVSVVIPVFNEAGGIKPCWAAVSEVLRDSGYSYELIFVDDGSSDSSLEEMIQLSKEDPQVIVIQLIRNGGQQKALFVGLRNSHGRAVITYDADLQFAPACLPELAAEILEGNDIAGGIRTRRRDSFFYNRLPSLFGQYLINTALGVRQKDFGAVKAYSRRLVQDIIRHSRDPLMIPATAYHLSKRFVEIPVHHQARVHGESKWTVLKRMELYFDIYTTYARRPFAWMMILGFVGICLSLLLAVGIVAYKFLVSPTFSGTIIFFDVFLFVFGLHFISLSLLGEFVVRIHRRDRPPDEGAIAQIFRKGDATVAHPITRQ